MIGQGYVLEATCRGNRVTLHRGGVLHSLTHHCSLQLREGDREIQRDFTNSAAEGWQCPDVSSARRCPWVLGDSESGSASGLSLASACTVPGPTPATAAPSLRQSGPRRPVQVPVPRAVSGRFGVDLAPPFGEREARRPPALAIRLLTTLLINSEFVMRK